MIKPDELPLKWGLLELRGTRVFEIVKAMDQTPNGINEMDLLLSIIRRTAPPKRGGVSVKCYSHQLESENPRATLSVAADDLAEEIRRGVEGETCKD